MAEYCQADYCCMRILRKRGIKMKITEQIITSTRCSDCDMTFTDDLIFCPICQKRLDDITEDKEPVSIYDYYGVHYSDFY